MLIGLCMVHNVEEEVGGHDMLYRAVRHGIAALQEQSCLTYNVSVIYMPRFSCIGGVDSVDRVLQAVTFVYVLQEEEEASWHLLLL